MICDDLPNMANNDIIHMYNIHIYKHNNNELHDIILYLLHSMSKEYHNQLSILYTYTDKGINATIRMTLFMQMLFFERKYFCAYSTENSC